MSKADKAIDEILEEFDFKEVRMWMLLTGWVYARDHATPSISTLKETARDLLQKAVGAHALGEKEYLVETGGLRAELNANGDYPAELTLLFIPLQTTVYL